MNRILMINLTLARLYLLLCSTIAVTSLFFSTNVLSNMLIVKDDKLAKNLSIKDQEGKVIIDIEHSDIKGVSHNYYENFNVGKKGVIFKNLKATLIINEVTSDKSSHLAGDLSVEGRLANIVIANPNGITCEGCAFDGVEKITLINGITDKSTIGKFLVSKYGSINFKSSKREKGKPFTFKHINIISKNIAFHPRVNFIANQAVFFNGSKSYNLFNQGTETQYRRGSIIFYKDTVLNVNELKIYTGKSKIINKGVLNLGRVNIESRGAVENFNQINILSGKIYPYLRKLKVEYPLYDFEKKHSKIIAKSLRNKLSSRFTLYNTNMDINLLRGGVITEGYMRLEYSKLAITGDNYLYHNNATAFFNDSFLELNIENNISSTAIIDIRNSHGLINKGRVINIHEKNASNFLIKNTL